MRTDGQITIPEDANSEERAAFAHNLRMQGKSWREIYGLADYKSEPTAKLMVRAWLQKAVLEMEQTTRAEHLTLEIDRLDKLQDAVWDEALFGSTKAIDSVIKIITLRARLLGLDTITAEIDARTQTVVIANNADYIKQLKAIAGSTDE